MDSSPNVNVIANPLVPPETAALAEGSDILFSLHNAEPNLCLFRSAGNYSMRCAHIGCTLPLHGSSYCCPDHKTYAASSANVRTPFRYVDSFWDEKDRERICCTLLYNRRRGLQVGVPYLEERYVGDVFSKPPWEQPPLFSTNMGTTDFLFFMKPPPKYKTMTIGPNKLKLKWHSRVRFGLHVEGCEDQETVFMTQFFLDLEKQFRADNDDLYQRCKRWYLFHFESGEHSLYCLTSSRSGGAAEPTVAREQKNKKVPTTDDAPSTSSYLAPGKSGPPNQSHNSSAGKGKGNTSSAKPPMPQPQALTLLKRDLYTTSFEESFTRIISESFPGVFVFEMPSEVGKLRERVHGTKLQITTSKYVFFPEVCGSIFDSHHGFVVEYGADRDVDLGFHVDVSETTLSVCLGIQFEGGRSYFQGTRCKKHDVNTDTKPEVFFDDAHIPDQAVLRHGPRATTSGHGANMILWSRSSAFKRDEKISEGILKLVRSMLLRKERKAKPDSWCQKKGVY